MVNEKRESMAKEVHHETKKEILNESEISIILDTYNDIFSSFDPRPYTLRELSDDFIAEAKKAMKQKAPGKVELKFLVPEKQRNISNETIIKKRIKEYSRYMLEQTSKKIKNIRKRAINLISVGTAIGIVATIVATWLETSIIKNALLILLEPASWFTMWNGFEQFFFATSTKQHEQEFYHRMNNLEISFTGY